MRARPPDRAGYAERDGVRIHYESYGAGEHTIVFVPDVMITSEAYKAQVPYLARSYRVVVLDPRGNGRSDRPAGADAYTDVQQIGDVLAVMDELGVARAVISGICDGGYVSLALAATHPERVDGVVTIGVAAITGTPRPDRGSGAYDDLERTWTAPLGDQQGWYQFNRELWLTEWPRWPAFFFSKIVNDAHATKVYEDMVDWACCSTGEAQADANETEFLAETPAATAELLARVECPVLCIHGTHDFCEAFGRGGDVAGLTGGELLALGGCGHVPNGRDPVAVNHAIADFLRRVHAGEVVRRRHGPGVVRARLSTRLDPAPPLHDGRRVAGGTAYGEGEPVVVVIPDTGAASGSWSAELPALAAHVPLLLLDDAASLTTALDAAHDPLVVLAPPGSGELAAAVRDDERVAGVVLVEAPAALAEQPGLLAFFFHHLSGAVPPTAVVTGLGATSGERSSRPTIVVVDDRAQEGSVPAHAIVTVEGGVAPDLAVRPTRRHRERRVLYLSSPIGLGHVRRDLAVAEALRRREPDLRVDWLSQSPVTEFLEANGEHVHPASKWLANESGHIESEAGEHDLHAFQAIRRMDEILVNNFHVFDDLVREEEYDAWVGDEAWDLDHFLHENPRLKRAPFVWMTDFVGWLPMPDGGEAEAALTADYNAEMVEHVARYPRLRDRSVFVGDPEDLVPDGLGPGLPGIRAWTEEHFAFSGYVMGERPDPADRDGLRRRLGYRPDETVCVVSVGGSGVGEPLIRRVVDAYDACRARVPSLRMHVVTGPRLDPESVRAPDGVAVHGFLPDLDLHHAACDIAIVQGGLSTTMELTASGRPFLYFPLRHHFEQQYHVRHRLDRHGAGAAMDFETADPDSIAEALVTELEHPRAYRPVPEDGAARAAELVAEVL